MRRDGPFALAPLLLLLLATPLARAQEESEGNVFQRLWRKGANVLKSWFTTPAPAVTPAEEAPANNTTPVPAVALPVSGTVPPPVAQDPVEVTVPERTSSPEESDESREGTGQATDKQVGDGSGDGGGGAAIIPWWVGLLTGLTLAGWMAVCAVAIMYRRGCALAVQRQQETFEMTKLPAPIDFHRFFEPPPCYQNSSYQSSPGTHIYEEPQFPSDAAGGSRDTEPSRKPSISTRPPAVPFRPQEGATHRILSDSGTVEPRASIDTSATHRNSLYNRVPSLTEGMGEVCPLCSVETDSGRAVVSACGPAGENKESGEISETGRGTKGEEQPQWKFLLPGGRSGESTELPSGTGTACGPDSSFIGCPKCSATIRQYDVPSNSQRSSQGNKLANVYEVDESTALTTAASSVSTTPTVVIYDV